MNRLIQAAVLLPILAVAGCQPATTDVSGKVKYQGKPVVFGSVVVFDADGAPKSGVIQPDGTFLISGVRTGAVKVAVSSPTPPGTPSRTSRDVREGAGGEAERTPTGPPPAPPDVIKNWVAIPDKYGDPDKSELTAEIKPGQPLDLDLK